jgi:hypothetical protein
LELAIAKGVFWLAMAQNPDGSWGEEPDICAKTAFALVKLQDRAWELGMSPFSEEYEYNMNVTAGWEYLLENCVQAVPIGVQLAGDPDINGNEFGVVAGTWDHHWTYTTGVFLLALQASRTPWRLTGIDLDLDGVEDTFFDLAQDAVDWLSFAQGDINHGPHRGGFWYTANSTGAPCIDTLGGAKILGTDNSNSGYAVLGLAAGEAFGCTVPQFVKDELSLWINVIQDPVSGGSLYTPGGAWINLLKTGNLLFQMTFVGDPPSSTRFQNALGYIENMWNTQNQDPGWKGDWGVDDDLDTWFDEDRIDAIDNDGDLLFDEDPGLVHFQAMFCLMKGLAFSGVDLLDLDGDATPEHDWFAEFVQAIIDGQYPDGYWDWGMWGDTLLNTVWAPSP